MGKWMHALQAFGTALAVVGAGIVMAAATPEVVMALVTASASEAVAYESAMMAGIAVGVITASTGTTIATSAGIYNEEHPIAPHYRHLSETKGGGLVRGRGPIIEEKIPGGDDENVQNDPDVVILPFEPNPNDPDDHDPWEDPVDPWEVGGTRGRIGDGLRDRGQGSETKPKKPKKNPLASTGGDFSGLVTTFLDPVTSRIIGYKGIPRKRKFHSLARFSPFWAKRLADTPMSILSAPFSP